MYSLTPGLYLYQIQITKLSAGGGRGDSVIVLDFEYDDSCGLQEKLERLNHLMTRYDDRLVHSHWSRTLETALRLVGS